MVWDAGSLGQKSSDARTTAVCFELSEMPELIMPRIAWRLATLHPLISFNYKEVVME